MQLQQEVEGLEAWVGLQENWYIIQGTWQLQGMTVWGLRRGAEQKEWNKIIRGNKITKKVASYYVHLSNAYEQLEEFSAEVSPPTPEHKPSTTINTNDRNKHQSKFNLKAERRRQTKFTKYIHKMKDEGIIDC